MDEVQPDEGEACRRTTVTGDHTEQPCRGPLRCGCPASWRTRLEHRPLLTRPASIAPTDSPSAAKNDPIADGHIALLKQVQDLPYAGSEENLPPAVRRSVVTPPLNRSSRTCAWPLTRSGTSSPYDKTPMPPPTRTKPKPASSDLICKLAEHLRSTGTFIERRGRPPLGARTLVQEICRICQCSRDVVHRALSGRSRSAKQYRPRVNGADGSGNVSEIVAHPPSVLSSTLGPPPSTIPTPPGPGGRDLTDIGLRVITPATVSGPRSSTSAADAAREALAESLDYYLSVGSTDPETAQLALALQRYLDRGQDS